MRRGFAFPVAPTPVTGVDPYLDESSLRLAGPRGVRRTARISRPHSVRTTADCAKGVTCAGLKAERRDHVALLKRGKSGLRGQRDQLMHGERQLTRLHTRLRLRAGASMISARSRASTSRSAFSGRTGDRARALASAWASDAVGAAAGASHGDSGLA